MGQEAQDVTIPQTTLGETESGPSPDRNAADNSPPNVSLALGEAGGFTEMEPATITFNMTAAQRVFSTQNISVLIIIIFGLGVTYWIMGRALRPLTVLSETIHDINEHNLSKVIEANTAKDEVGSIAASFNGMLGRLRGAFEQQKRFSASAAHELKTPLPP